MRMVLLAGFLLSLHTAAQLNDAWLSSHNDPTDCSRLAHIADSSLFSPWPLARGRRNVGTSAARRRVRSLVRKISL